MSPPRASTRTRAQQLLLVASAALDRVASDPSSVGMALAGGGAAHPVARLLAPATALAGALGWPGMRVLAAHSRGDADEVARLVAAARRAGPLSRRSTAGALLATGRPDEASALVQDDPSRGAHRLRARAAWAAGRWSESVALTRSRSLRRRREEELALLSRRPAGPAAAASPAGPAVPAAPASVRAPGGGLRVLHLVTNSLPHTRSGYTGRTHDILRAQARAGMTVSAVTPVGYPATLLRLPAGTVEVVDGVAYHRLLPLTWPSSPRRRHAEELRLLGHLVERDRPDVLHAHSHFVNALTALEVGLRYGIPVVYEVRGMLEETWAQRSGPDARASERYRLFRDQEAWCVRAVDAALTIGEAMRDALASRTPGARPVGLVPNAVPTSALTERGDREATRRALGIPADHLVVGSVSSVVDYEGFEVLVEAVAQLGARGRAVTLLLVGDGAGAASVRAAALAVRPPAAVVMTGRVPKEQVPDHLAALDVFVVPRRDLDVCRLVTPLKPAEAMAAGLPLVVSDLPALHEFVDDGVEGLVVPAEDPAALADALEVLRDPALRSRMGAAGHARVAATRTWEANVATYRRTYDEVVSRRR